MDVGRGPSLPDQGRYDGAASGVDAQPGLIFVLHGGKARPYIDRPAVELRVVGRLARRQQRVVAFHQIEVGFHVEQFAPRASINYCLARAAALFRVHGANAAHEGCEMCWRSVGV